MARAGVAAEYGKHGGRFSVVENESGAERDILMPRESRSTRSGVFPFGLHEGGRLLIYSYVPVTPNVRLEDAMIFNRLLGCFQ